MPPPARQVRTLDTVFSPIDAGTTNPFRSALWFKTPDMTVPQFFLAWGAAAAVNDHLARCSQPVENGKARCAL
jgi:hypothetical protein